MISDVFQAQAQNYANLAQVSNTESKTLHRAFKKWPRESDEICVN